MGKTTAESILSEFDPLSNSPSTATPSHAPCATTERIFSRSAQPPTANFGPVDGESSYGQNASRETGRPGASGGGGRGGESGITRGGLAVIQQAEKRRQGILDELTGDPYSTVIDQPLGGEGTSERNLESREGGMGFGAIGIPILRARERRSSAGRSTSGIAISPPRRLASLMDLLPTNDDSTKAMAIPQISSPPLDLFHPSSPPTQDHFPTASTSNLSASPDWDDFQSAPSLPPLPPSTSNAGSPPFVSSSLTKTRLPRASSESTTTRRISAGRQGGGRTTGQKGWKTEWDYDAHGNGAIQPVVLMGVTPGLVKALEEDIAEAIRPNLPPRLRISTRWRLLYSVDQHGTSLKTMYECMEDILGEVDGGCVLVVKDTQGRTFGAFINEGLREQKTYYGDGTCFLWKATPFPASDFRVGHSVKSYKWTGLNEYYILTDSRSISVGGGDGRFGLWIDGVFEKGYSSRCPCFGNEPLVDWERGRGIEEAQFEVLQFEVWAVGL